jgi:hypothetical protein
MTTIWNSISISDIVNGVKLEIFYGYFSVVENLITGVYEKINGSTDFNNNILINNLDNFYNLGLAYNPTTGYNVYNLYNYNINNINIKDDIILDNVYGSKNTLYPGFTPFGIGLTSFSYFSNGKPQFYNFSINYSPNNKHSLYITDINKGRGQGISINNLDVNIKKITNPIVQVNLQSNNISLYSIGVSEKSKDVEIFYRNISIDDITKFYDAKNVGINILTNDGNNENINGGITYNKSQRLITDFKITNILSFDALNGYTEWNITWIVQTDGSLKILSFFVK